MAKIKVHDLKPTGSELFNDSESFMNELSSDELGQAMGGGLGDLKLVLLPTRTIIISCFCPPPIIVDRYSPVIL